MIYTPKRKTNTMRKITQEAVRAFYAKEKFCKSNTTCIDGQMFLHGNLIATLEKDGLKITTSGWDTTTTKERLNGLEGVQVNTRKGQLFLNGEKWNGVWKAID